MASLFFGFGSFVLVLNGIFLTIAALWSLGTGEQVMVRWWYEAPNLASWDEALLNALASFALAAAFGLAFHINERFDLF